MVVTHAVALLNSLGASHHMIPLQSTSLISNSFPTMTDVSPSAFHHHNEACLGFFVVFFIFCLFHSWDHIFSVICLNLIIETTKLKRPEPSAGVNQWCSCGAQKGQEHLI